VAKDKRNKTQTQLDWGGVGGAWTCPDYPNNQFTLGRNLHIPVEEYLIKFNEKGSLVPD
jgi:hypothetical protein